MKDLRLRQVAVVGFLVVIGCALSFAKELTLDELKARVADASIGERPGLCVEIAERQVETASRSYEADDIAKGQAALVDVTAFAELARDYAIQSRSGRSRAKSRSARWPANWRI